MSIKRRKISLDLEVCYSGFKSDELEYIGNARTDENDQDDFLDTFSGKLENGGSTGDEEILNVGEYDSNIFSAEGSRSYLCSTPTGERLHRGSFPQDADVSGFTDADYARAFPAKLDSGLRSQSISAANSLASFFGDENDSVIGGSLESLPGTGRVLRQIPQLANNNMRKKIELDSDLHDPYSNVDDFELSIEEEQSHLTHGNNTSTLVTLKRRLSIKALRRNISTGLFGSYMQRNPALPPPPHSTNNSQTMTNDQTAPLFDNKPTGPVNLWFRKFRNRHYI